MANNHFNEKRRKSSGKWSMFAAVCLAFVAIGAALWFALGNDKTGGGDGSSSSHYSSTSSHSKVIDTVSDEMGPAKDKVSSVISDVTDGISSIKDEIEDMISMPSHTETATEATFFVMPVAGEIIKDYSGEELLWSETFGDYRAHKGVDIKAAAGTAVNASGHGVVADIFEDGVLGTVVAVDHGNGIVAYYCGLKPQPLVKKGDKVEASQPIGSVGEIPGECVVAHHLHLEVKKNGENVSPLEILGLK